MSEKLSLISANSLDSFVRQVIANKGKLVQVTPEVQDPEARRKVTRLVSSLPDGSVVYHAVSGSKQKQREKVGRMGRLLSIAGINSTRVNINYPGNNPFKPKQLK